MVWFQKATPGVHRRHRLSMNRRNTFEAYVFLSPFIIGTLIFFIFPLTLLLRLSFGNLYSVMGMRISFAGLDNFKRAFLTDTNFLPNFLQSMRDTAIKFPLTIIFSLLIALLLNKDIKFRGLFRTIFFLPFLLGNGYVMDQLLKQNVDDRAMQSAQFFLPSELMTYLGTGISSIVTSVFSVIIVILWGTGVQMLLFLSGLQGISTSYYEAARLESASEWDCFWHITLPMLSPIILLCIVYTLVDSFTNITNPVLQYINFIFLLTQYDYSAAIGMLYSTFVLLVVLLVFLLMRRTMFITETRGGKKIR